MSVKKRTGIGKKATKSAFWNFSATEYGRKGKVVASEEVKAAIQKIGITGARGKWFSRANVIRKMVRGLPIKRVSYTELVRWLRDYNSVIPAANSQ